MERLKQLRRANNKALLLAFLTHWHLWPAALQLSGVFANSFYWNQKWVSVQRLQFPSLNYSRKRKMQPQEGRRGGETDNFWKWFQEKEEWAGVGRTGVGVSKTWLATTVSHLNSALNCEHVFFFNHVFLWEKKKVFPPILKQQQHLESAVWAVIPINVVSGSEPLWKQFAWYSVGFAAMFLKL